MSPTLIRCLIVDDDAVSRRLITRALDKCADAEFVGAVQSVAQAKSIIGARSVDLILCDVVLNGESGLDLVDWLRRERNATSVYLLSATSEDVKSDISAALVGANGFLQKPQGPKALDELADGVAAAVRDVKKRSEAAARKEAAKDAARNIAVARDTDGTGSGARRVAVTAPPSLASDLMPRQREIIAIGASTGGPPAVTQVLRSLPDAFQIPIVLTQHMPAEHLRYFADFLGRTTGKNVQLGRAGELVRRGVIYVAPPEGHMIVRRNPSGALELGVIQGPPEHNCLPAVDPMFRSVADSVGRRTLCVLLTGMGSDGAKGARILRDTGATIVVQDQESSVVWGMPGAAVAEGAPHVVTPITEVGPWILKLCDAVG